jgi:4-amino-4-deoxy-L-arabinose transferase-like glycosyltransferase
MTGDEPPTREAGSRRFVAGLVGISVFGLILRVAYVLTVTRYDNSHFYDAFYYVGQAGDLATGHGFQTPVVGGASALHPPLTALVEVPASWLFGIHGGTVPQRMTMAVLGAVAVGVIGWLGKVVAGHRVGIITAVVAALYPNLWIPSGIVMSETLAILLTALILIATYRFLRSPGWVNATLLGVGCGLAALTRSELSFFVLLILVPAVVVARTLSGRARVALAVLGIVVAGVVVSPWVVRNLVTFQKPTTLSTGDGGLLLGANCDATYHGVELGYWSLGCSTAVTPSNDPSVLSARQDHAAFSYMRHHLSRLPVVVAARVGRIWDLYEPFQTARFDQGEGRPVEASWAGIGAFYLLAPLAIAGFIVLGRQRKTRWPLVMPVVLVTLLAAGAYGIIRFRAPAEVSLVVLAAVALDAGWRHWTSRRAPRSEPDPATLDTAVH